ncbi:trichohyalin-like [Macrobrachium rosenbergii]|uniref:trichohyalin-like n=1 Tax=Macrobrachium rosenbergii TaxID=79674 RepID=UPI0034D5EC23
MRKVPARKNEEKSDHDNKQLVGVTREADAEATREKRSDSKVAVPRAGLSESFDDAEWTTARETMSPATKDIEELKEGQKMLRRQLLEQNEREKEMQRLLTLVREEVKHLKAPEEDEKNRKIRDLEKGLDQAKRRVAELEEERSRLQKENEANKRKIQEFETERRDQEEDKEQVSAKEDKEQVSTQELEGQVKTSATEGLTTDPTEEPPKKIGQWEKWRRQFCRCRRDKRNRYYYLYSERDIKDILYEWKGVPFNFWWVVRVVSKDMVQVVYLPSAELEKVEKKRGKVLSEYIKRGRTRSAMLEALRRGNIGSALLWDEIASDIKYYEKKPRCMWIQIIIWFIHGVFMMGFDRMADVCEMYENHGCCQRRLQSRSKPQKPKESSRKQSQQKIVKNALERLRMKREERKKRIPEETNRKQSKQKIMKNALEWLRMRREKKRKRRSA